MTPDNKVIMRLVPDDPTKVQVYLDGTLATIVPVWRLEQIVEEYQKIKNRPPGEFDVHMAG